MKKFIGSLMLAAFTACAFAGGGVEAGSGGKSSRGAANEDSRDADPAAFTAELAKLPKEALSVKELAGLLKLREEEKLARDVYAFLGEKWNSRSFENIEKSEGVHMDFVASLLVRYGIEDPVKSDGRGTFSNPDFGALYKDLTAKGSVSAAEAYAVGLMIEELDIKDVKEALAAADNADLRILYLNLEKGSRNHLRAFKRRFDREGASYTPSYLTAAEVQTILAADDRGLGLLTDPNYRF